MAYTDHFSAYGISEVGEYTGPKGGPYVETPYGKTTQEGGTVNLTTNVIRQFSGQSAAAIDSFTQTVEGSFAVSLLSSTLTNLKRMFGLPDTALTGDLTAGTPTQEVLSVKGSDMGTVEKSLYMRTMGPLGPRTVRMPRAKVSTPPNIVAGRNGYFEPNATFDLYEDPTTGDFFFIEDPPA
jgi:hypothetical protein